jgi:hypothetical protein
MTDKKSPTLLQTLSTSADQYDADNLTYPDLKTVIDEFYSSDYESLHTAMWDENNLVVIPPDSHHKHLLLTAHKLQEAATHEEKRLWTERYTNASIALYGAPKPEEIVAIASDELSYFASAGEERPHDNEYLNNVLKRYELLSRSGVNKQQANDIDSRSAHLLPDVKKFFTWHYSDALNCFETYSSETLLTADQVFALYDRALKMLAKKDSSWREWTVVWRNGASFSVFAPRKLIQVGRFIPPLTVMRCRSLFAHEVLVHAQRSVNGEKLDPILATGMPGYLPAEEGFAILVESSFLGHIPHRVKDRYIDIALALGMSQKQPMSRPELFEFAFARAMLRAEKEGDETSESVMRRVVWQHVNRLYRGTLGNQYVGVFTRDIVYYDGLKEIMAYIDNSAERTEKVLDFLLQGKFHPCIDEQESYVRNVINGQKT